MQNVKIIECPRDAMQGVRDWIPTKEKAQFIQSLLDCGFNTIDFGSFVSPKAIPQMKDTSELLSLLDLSSTESQLLAIVANIRGAKDAVMYHQIDYLGYPFSISENFQMRNTHKTINQSIETLKEILNLADSKNKKVVAYLSMGFGNPYGDPWSVDIVGEWTEKLSKMGVNILSLSDTVGSSSPEIITYLFSELIIKYPSIEFGAHLHTTTTKWKEKISAAYLAGCRRFDGAIQGFGGCPMAKDDLTGNMPTEKILSYFAAEKVNTNVNSISFENAYKEASKIFNKYH
ncbi:MAG: hydroxymethylglutaryl-CoA lyase [Flavobacteriaceae bacterium]|nr:hydroxymethylglutaryl-CoA lyase [Flavobacteriaceae bacterium]|tara:strand:- start:60575 stop:61438 length:864 start_codon:yes stop_codon:yes gene_type:complete